MQVVSTVKAVALASAAFFAKPQAVDSPNLLDNLKKLPLVSSHHSELANLRLPANMRPAPSLSANQNATNTTEVKFKNLHLLLLVGTITSGALGYLRYATGSTPDAERKKFIWPRLGSMLFPGQPFVKGDYSAMQNWVVIHASNLVVGAAALIGSGATFASIVSMSAPAIFLAGTVGCLKTTAKHGSKDTHPLLLGCKSLSYAALGIFIAAKFNLLHAALPLKPDTMTTLAIVMALTARTLGSVGFTWKYIKSAIEDSPKFPQLANMALWTAATAFGAAAIVNPASQASWIPIGYFIQNIIMLGTGLVSYAVWNARKRQ